MIPAAFDYIRPDSLDEAVSALAGADEDAKVLAGGHSLLPLMRLRLAAPSLLIDVGRIAALRGVRDEGNHIAVGAATTHYEVVKDRTLATYCAIVPHVTEKIGDPQVRHRGTHGGALAHGDAAGDLPAVALMCDAQILVQGSNGQRTIAAADFFQDYLETALEPDEIVVEVRWPKYDNSWRWNYQKFGRSAQAWAIVGSAALVRRDNGSIAEARIGLTNMGNVPVRSRTTEQMLAGTSVDDLGDAVAHAADEAISVPVDLNAREDYRRHLAQVLTRRAIQQALAETP